MLFKRLYVLVFIHHDTRLVRITGVTTKPVTDWVTQQARNVSLDLANQANTVKFLIRDRDTKFTASFDAVFAAEVIHRLANDWPDNHDRTRLPNGSCGPSALSASTTC